MDELLEEDEVKKRKAVLAQVAEELKYDLSVVLTNKIDFTRCSYSHDIRIYYTTLRYATLLYATLLYTTGAATPTTSSSWTISE